MNILYRYFSATCIIILLIQNFAGAQTNHNFLQWSNTRKLTTEDFEIKIENRQSDLCFGQFYTEYNVTGLDFMTKNFNKKVKNIFIKSASWIDINQDTDLCLKYQQTLFDLSEIYVRKFRMELKENRKQIAKGLQIVDEINIKMTTEFTKRRLEYDLETNYGSDEEKQTEWEEQIKKELQDLAEFDYYK